MPIPPGFAVCWIGLPATIWLIGVMVLIGIRGESSFNSKSQDYGSLTSRIEDGVNWGETKVTYPDFYEFGVSGKTENKVPNAFSKNCAKNRKCIKN